MALDVTFGETEFENVRKSIDLNFTSNELPDETIQLPIYEGEAARIIKRAVSGLDEPTQEANQDSLKMATSLLAAARIAPRVRVLLRATLEEDVHQYQSRDFDKISDDLEKQAFEIVSDILADAAGETETALASKLFLTVKACPK